MQGIRSSFSPEGGRLLLSIFVILSLAYLCIQTPPVMADRRYIDKLASQASSSIASYRVLYFRSGTTRREGRNENADAILSFHGLRLRELPVHQALMNSIATAYDCHKIDEGSPYIVELLILSPQTENLASVLLRKDGRVDLGGESCKLKDSFANDILRTVEESFTRMTLAPKQDELGGVSVSGNRRRNNLTIVSLLNKPYVFDDGRPSALRGKPSLSSMLLRSSAESTAHIEELFTSKHLSLCRPEGGAVSMLLELEGDHPLVGYDGVKSGFVGDQWCDFDVEARNVLDYLLSQVFRRWGFQKSEDVDYETWRTSISNFSRSSNGKDITLTVSAVKRDTSPITYLDFNEVLKMRSLFLQVAARKGTGLSIYERLMEALLSPSACEVNFSHTDLRLAVRVQAEQIATTLDIGFGHSGTGTINGFPCHFSPELLSLKKELWDTLLATGSGK